MEKARFTSDTSGTSKSSSSSSSSNSSSASISSNTTSEEFIKKFSRLLDFFCALPSTGENASNFFNHLVEMASELDLAQLNNDEIIIFVFLSRFHGNKICNLKSRCPSRIEDFQSIIDQFFTRAAAAAGEAAAATVQNATANAEAATAGEATTATEKCATNAKSVSQDASPAEAENLGPIPSPQSWSVPRVVFPQLHPLKRRKIQVQLHSAMSIHSV